MGRLSQEIYIHVPGSIERNNQSPLSACSPRDKNKSKSVNYTLPPGQMAE